MHRVVLSGVPCKSVCGSEKWSHSGRILHPAQVSTPGGGASAGSNPFPVFPRAAGRTIRFWTLPCGGSSRKVKSPARQPASLVVVSAAVNQWQSGPCGPAIWPLRALPPAGVWRAT
jgi:hypothetical protein